MSDRKSLARQAFDVSYGQLINQGDDLKHFRNQASFSCAVTGLIATFFSSVYRLQGAKGFDCNANCFFGLPLAAFFLFCSIALALLVAMSSVISLRTVNLNLNPEAFVHASENNSSETETLIKLAKDATEFFDTNEDAIADAHHRVAVSLLFGWVQIPIWLMLIFGVK